MATKINFTTLINWLLILNLNWYVQSEQLIIEKVCQGENGELWSHSNSFNKTQNYKLLKERYKDCTKIEGNLELVSIQGFGVDLKFLENLREVTGAVFIHDSGANRVSLPNLRIIRGYSLVGHHGMPANLKFGLSVGGLGITSLEFPSLREISRGNVAISSNNKLCHLETIDWREIMSDPSAKSFIHLGSIKGESCSCDSSCQGKCWRTGADMCQLISKLNCHSSCAGERCFGLDAGECCHPTCAGGCTGPTNQNCLFCKAKDDGECKAACPPLTIYNLTTGTYERNPNGKYNYHGICLKSCPANLVADDASGKCVEDCPIDMLEVKGKCVACQPPSCKICDTAHAIPIDSQNINRFTNCTIIRGKISIIKKSFDSSFYQQSKTGSSSLQPSQLEVFASLKKLQGSLEVAWSHPNFKSLEYFRNLEIITLGRREGNVALDIRDTSLEALQLKSLRKIRGGNVEIHKNNKLCYINEMNWSKILNGAINFSGNRPNRQCSSEGKLCSSQCKTEDGCWGHSSQDCLTCANYKLEDDCVTSCNVSENSYEESPGVCKYCHKPLFHIVRGKGTKIGCLEEDEPCPFGFIEDKEESESDDDFYDYLVSLLGTSTCNCSEYLHEEKCLEKCPENFYEDEKGMKCLKCHEECKECSGPRLDECIGCKNFKMINEEESGRMINFTCVANCPANLTVIEDDDGFFCVRKMPAAEMKKRSNLTTILLSLLLSLLVVGCAIGGAFYFFKRRRDRTKRMIKEKLARVSKESTPLTKPKPIVKPNLSKFRTITEEALRRDHLLGSGAFGTVYKGIWHPENNIIIPVAIKVLKQTKGSQATKEFLDEAYIMASVEHPHLLQLLAVCLSSEPMLITQLMPLGNLKDYVGIYRNQIGSKVMISWYWQIAKGMEYLESRRLVHRDLAARNVLVQSSGIVKITDFGLAKLLDLGEEEYKADGGKLPVKWLAIECIKERVFTHMSDVWAFGVTIWEILTYGATPYEKALPKDVPALLLKGERLPQPEICTLELFMVLIRTWMVDPESRPSFKELVEEFGRMLEDPARYLVIVGDALMRPPDSTPQDEKELMRSLSIRLTERQVVMDAEEYLKVYLPTDDDDYLMPSTSSRNDDALSYLALKSDDSDKDE